MKKALIVWGGWDGHEPKQVGEVFQRILEEREFDVTVADTLDVFDDVKALSELDLIIPVWTMSELSHERAEKVSLVVANGTGMAGCHGGMCDAFRNNTLWQFITGGNWVSHPGGDGVEYEVNIRSTSNPLTAGIEDFKVTSEQYYLHVDPAVEVLATTRLPTVRWYHSANGVVDMPVVWTKRWGLGRIYYNSLGHHADVFDIPGARELMTRGMLWAAEGKAVARASGLDARHFASDAKMF